MTNRISEAIEAILKSDPNLSKEEVVREVINFIERELPEIIKRTEIPKKDSPLSDIKKYFIETRRKVRHRKLKHESFKKELIEALRIAQDLLIEERDTRNARKIEQDIERIEKSSSSIISAYSHTELDIQEIEEKFRKTESRDSKIMRTLKDLTDQDKND